jgi:hypothetical protein
MMKMIEESEMVLVKEGLGLSVVGMRGQCRQGRWDQNGCLYRQ